MRFFNEFWNATSIYDLNEFEECKIYIHHGNEFWTTMSICKDNELREEKINKRMTMDYKTEHSY